MEDGTVINCTAFGNVTGEWGNHWYTGGLIGALNWGTIINCTAYGDVSGADASTGGLIGWGNGPVTNCNAFGDVYGTGDYVGGMIGENNDKRRNKKASRRS